MPQPCVPAPSRLPGHITRRLRLPLIAAPMLAVSGVDLVVAACRNGVIGAFPTANARSAEQLDQWLTQIDQRLFAAPEEAAPCCPNLIMRSPRLAEDLACLLAHRVEMVITSVGSPAPVVGPLHGIGCLVLADVATLDHARKAMAAGADGLVLLSAGAGGQTGWLNPLAFVRALRTELRYTGPLVLAGGISDGVALRAAQVLGCDLAYMGTRFIATRESLAADAYRQMLVAASADDVLLTRAFTGLPTSMLLPSIRRAGLDPARLDELVSPQTAAQMFGSARHRADRADAQPASDAAKAPPDGHAGSPATTATATATATAAATTPTTAADGPRRWTDIWSAGHSVSGVQAVQTVAELVAEVEQDFHHALA